MENNTTYHSKYVASLLNRVSRDNTNILEDNIKTIPIRLKKIANDLGIEVLKVKMGPGYSGSIQKNNIHIGFNKG